MKSPGPVATVLTPRGRGAIASLRLRGEMALLDQDEPVLFRAANGKPLAQQALGRLVFGRWGREPGEEVVVCRHDETTTDIHCHGGDAASSRILADLAAAGC